MTNVQAEKLDVTVSESIGCCFSEETKLIAPLHPSPFPEAALHGHKFYSSKCTYMRAWLTTIKPLHCSVIPVKPQHKYGERPWHCSSPQHTLARSHACLLWILLPSSKRSVLDVEGALSFTTGSLFTAKRKFACFVEI